MTTIGATTKGTRYHVPPKLLLEAGLDKLTTLKRVQPHRLRALIIEDLERAALIVGVRRPVEKAGAANPTRKRQVTSHERGNLSSGPSLRRALLPRDEPEVN